MCFHMCMYVYLYIIYLNDALYVFIYSIFCDGIFYMETKITFKTQTLTKKKKKKEKKAKKT